MVSTRPTQTHFFITLLSFSSPQFQSFREILVFALHTFVFCSVFRRSIKPHFSMLELEVVVVTIMVIILHLYIVITTTISMKFIKHFTDG